jgi:phosphatidylglycerophosphate synthase
MRRWYRQVVDILCAVKVRRIRLITSSPGRWFGIVIATQQSASNSILLWCIGEAGGNVEYLDMNPSQSAAPDEKGSHRSDRTTGYVTPLSLRRCLGAVVLRLPAEYVTGIAIGIELAVLALGALCLILTGQTALAWFRYICGALAGTFTLRLLVVAVRHRVGRESFTAADALTRGRFAAGTMLAALTIAGFTARVTPGGGIAWGIALFAATLMDWLDGPIARHVGPTRMGAALDIEADSWLTLSTAAAAVVWGGLPWWVLAPPLVRYIHPIRAWLSGGLPSGGGPWWARITGVAQMALLLAALAPAQGDARDAILSAVAFPIVGAQLLALLASFIRPAPAAACPPPEPEQVVLLHNEEDQMLNESVEGSTVPSHLPSPYNSGDKGSQ